MMRFALLSASAITLLCAPATAAQIAKVSKDFNFIGVSGTDGELSSTLDCTAGLCTVFDQLKFYQPHDGQVNLNWTRADGSTLLDGKVPWDFTLSGRLNTDIGRESSWQYVGFHFGKPAYQQLTGQADFRGSVTINRPCPTSVCDEDYLELPHRIPDVFGGSSSGTGEQLAQPQAAVSNPQISITWRLSNLSVPDGSPFGTEPARDPVIEFSSTVEKLASGFQYSYAITNFTDDPVDFAIDKLDWNGTLDGHASLSREILSAIPPGLVTNTGEADQGKGRDLLSSFDVLQPVVPQAVPETETALLVVSGLACEVLARRRRRFGRRR